MKDKLWACVEVLGVYVVMRLLGLALSATGLMDAEVRLLGWSYTGGLIQMGVPLIVIWLTRRRWADYGVTLAGWQNNLDIGIKAYLVRIIPYVLGIGGTMLLKLDYRMFPGGLLVALTEIAGIAVLLGVLRRQSEEKALASVRSNVIVMVALLFLPILVGLAMRRLTLIVVSTVVWQFVFSGFGEEIFLRGYVQSRLNQAFGRPWLLLGVQCGPGLVIASLLFGLLHAFNTYNPAAGQYTLAWGWALFAVFGGLFFGLIREKTGSLLGCGIAHGLPDAVGEALAKVMGWAL
ncbi:MAG TPA: CPBP family intramembrane metalloprotease [Anaerolineae bacterium]|nr:CPBP family intramembrane metalloprotease [Anaerolineae bacterium]HQI86744.1 CPBP family intramembrane metalloprotease [Anaerolineae bacterium]